MLEQNLAKIVQKYPKKTAIVDDRSNIAYQELYDRIKGFSKGLSSLGISHCDCVAVVLPNCSEFVVSFYAAAKLNAIFLPLNHLFKEEELSYYINDSDAQVIITDTIRADLCHQIISKSERQIELITIDGANPSSTYFYDLILPEETKIEDNIVLAGENFLYQYSSGSTGRPKRVGRTQYNLYHEVNNFTQTAKITSADNILCLVPMYHAHGLGNCLLASIDNGATLVILEQFRQQGTPVEVPFIFRRLRVLELIEQEQITILPAVPYIFNTLAETPTDTQADLSSLRLCFSAGNFLSQDIYERFRARFGISIKQLYGCTEAGSVAIDLEDSDKPYGSVGRPMQNVELKIIGDRETQLPVGEIGEIVIKSETLTSEYHNMPELNQQTFKDRAFFTGDLGKIDESGHLYITGRKKILIDTGGRKVDPIEIEDVLITHANIKEAVVVGVKGFFAGEIIKAVIVTEGSQQCDAKEISAYCKARLAEFKVPRIIEFREEIPKSPLGKILRKALV
ncbi:MAG TPA: AMP-binding protein [Coleofasciculaceae cyanobacterium]|jgi:long-chain acyl-CoA synthetase